MSKFKISTQHEYVQSVNSLKKYDHHYFVEANPVVTDSFYDDLYFAVQDYEENHPTDVLPDSPTQKVGADATTNKRTIVHRTPMMSTKKCNSVKDVIKWMDSTEKAVNKMGYSLNPKQPYTIEWKYDGCSCSLVYMDGVLVEASTRGDYMFGLDILPHVKNIPSIPKVLRPGTRTLSQDIFVPNEDEVIYGRVEIRGEILMPFDNLQKTNGLYKDCRTAAASIINTEGESNYDSLLLFNAWQLITEWEEIDARGLPYFGPDNSHTGALCNMNNLLGFNVDGFTDVNKDIVEPIIETLAVERKNLPYPIDGLVIKLEDKTLWDKMGRTEHHPKFCIAYKFPPATAETVVTAIEITVGDTGKRTPIIYFEPVTLNGKVYTKASGGSEDVVEKNGIAVGKRVQFSLRNDVIPHIDCVIE